MPPPAIRIGSPFPLAIVHPFGLRHSCRPGASLLFPNVVRRLDRRQLDPGIPRRSAAIPSVPWALLRIDERLARWFASATFALAKFALANLQCVGPGRGTGSPNRHQSGGLDDDPI